MILSVLLCFLLFCCYPVITSITGYAFQIPENWLWLALGVFVLHGIAEEVMYRGFLFHHLREGRSFIKAATISVVFFAVSHIPIIINNGIIIGGTAVLLSIASSFPFAYLFEKGNNTIWAPALVHFGIDTIIPMLASNGFNEATQLASVLWMGFCILIPYLVFLFKTNPNLLKKLKNT
jgi:membrane protease YdiL (CAAX protease family)